MSDVNPTPESSGSGSFALPEGWYNPLKFAALILFPAVGALYYGLAGIWGFPNADDVVGTIVVVDTFLGVILGISTASYNKSDAKYGGALVGNPNAGYKLAFNSDLDELSAKKEVTLKVDPSDPKTVDDVDVDSD